MSDVTANGHEISRTMDATAPHRERRTGPLFIGDTLVSWGGEPLFLRDWRTQAAKDDHRKNGSRPRD